MITPIKTVNFYRFINGYSTSVTYTEQPKEYLVLSTNGSIKSNTYQKCPTQEEVEAILLAIEAIQTNED